MIQRNNVKHKRSQYEKYICMAHSQTSKLPLSYDGYLRFKEVVSVLELISNNDKSTFIYDGEIYNKPVTRSEAQTALTNIYNCKYSAAIKKVANLISLKL